jgi:hypothetical protein
MARDAMMQGGEDAEANIQTWMTMCKQAGTQGGKNIKTV